MGVNEPLIVWVQAAQGFHCPRPARTLRFGKTDAAGVIDKCIGAEHVAPAHGMRPHAEIVLLAIAFAEMFHIKQADFSHAIATDIHAESNRRRNIDYLSTVDLPE